MKKYNATSIIIIFPLFTKKNNLLIFNETKFPSNYEDGLESPFKIEKNFIFQDKPFILVNIVSSYTYASGSIASKIDISTK